jgi:protein SCO1
MKRNNLTLLGSLLILIGVIIAAVFLLNRAAEDSQPEEAARTLSPLRGSLYEPPAPIADFTLPATHGDFTYNEHRGKVMLFYFGYMTCPDYCPTTMAELQRVYRELSPEEQAQVEVIFFTVDPERDTLERMTPYLAAFHEDFIGVQPEALGMYDVLNQFGVTAVKQPVDSALGYLMDHTVSVFMVDADGWLITRYPYETPYEDILHDVRMVLKS